MEHAPFIWMDGELVPAQDAQVHVLSHALHYGTGVFEGIRAYRTSEGAELFRLTEHMERLHFSARAYGIPLHRSVDELRKAAREVVSAGELEEGYVRPLAYLGLGAVGLNPAGATGHVMIAAWKWGAYMGEEGIRDGIAARVSPWRRIDETVLIPTAKGSGAYLNSVLAKREALEAGAQEALLLNARGHVVEGSGENLFIVSRGLVRTPPAADGILEGITRHTIMTLLGEAGHPVEEASITLEDLMAAEEVFLTGTAAEVTPVRQIDDQPIGSGWRGPITQLAQELYGRAVRGELEDHRAWVEPV